MLNRIKENKALAFILAFFAILYGLISIPNHYNFRTAALDLGMFNHAIYSFSTFSHNYFTLDLGGHEYSYFGDHFSPITILFAPFRYLFGTYTLLILQIAAILWGGLGLFKIAKQKLKGTIPPILVIAQFFCIWGIFSGLAYDFHNNVIAAMILPWLIYYYDQKKMTGFIVLFLLFLLTKENMAFWLIFVFIGLAIKNRRNGWKSLLKNEVLFAAISFIYFLLVIQVFMPSLSGTENATQLGRYAHLGSSAGEIMGTFFKRPLYFLSLLFENHTTNPMDVGIKMETHIMVIASGGILLLLRPHYLVMLAPIYAQKLLSDNPSLWGINAQYSIEFAPIIALCIIEVLASLNREKLSIAILSIILISTGYATIDTIESRKSYWYNKPNHIFYRADHYQSGLDTKEVYNAIKLIPKDAILSTSTTLSPHLAFRDKIYHFPNVKDAEYIALITNQSTYPLSPEEMKSRTDELVNSGNFKVIYDKNNTLILQRENSLLRN